jgi:hypothetical protein
MDSKSFADFSIFVFAVATEPACRMTSSALVVSGLRIAPEMPPYVEESDTR